MSATPRNYRWLSFITALFVTTLVISNIIAAKLINLGGLFVPTAVILFPVAYWLAGLLPAAPFWVLHRVYCWLLWRRILLASF